MDPEKIGRYEIKSELGRGGMATVYRAYDPRFEREVAIKVLPREMMHDPNFRVRFEREAKTVASLEHPAIVPVYDVGEEDGQPYFVMRLMAGSSLADQIEKGPVSLQEAARIMDRLGPALDEAHSKGVIHRDLKPGNILFDRVGEPYVSDFGIAKIAQGQSTTVTGGAIIGTPAYMSPEQAQGETVDGRSDIYALGVILYEMLAGSQPYQATTPMAVVVKHITDPIPHILDVNPRLPAGIEVIIEKAMAKNPSDRFSTAGELAAALDALAGGQSVEEALKTATLSVTRAQAGRTRAAGRAGVASTVPAKGGGISPLVFVIPIVAVVVIAVVAVGGFFLLNSQKASLPPAATDTASGQPTTAAATIAPMVVVTSPQPTLAATSASVTATATGASIPAANAVGGADKVAFIANGNVWLMNIDGTGIKQLTSDGATKSSLQWMPDGKTLVFVSGKNVNTVDSETSVFDNVLTFPNATAINDFRISPDGKLVAIAIDREPFVVPFDLAALKSIHGGDGLKAMNGACLFDVAGTETSKKIRRFRWSADGKMLAWLYTGADAAKQSKDLIDVVENVLSCKPDSLHTTDEFPGGRFTPNGYASNSTLFDFDWDGKLLFLLNSAVRNNGWGYLYSYNYSIHQATLLDVLTGKCCYRDARWSPDGTYVFFAFQDITLGAQAPTQFYYVSDGAINTGATFKPIPLPDGFFKNQREAPQPALHAAQP